MTEDATHHADDDPRVTFSVSGDDPATIAADVLALGVTAGDDDRVVAGPVATAAAEVAGIDLERVCEAVGMDGSAGSTALVPAGDDLPVHLVVVCGLGSEATADTVRRAAAAATGVAIRQGSLVQAVGADADIDADLAARAVVEGTLLAHHANRAYRTDDDVRRLAQVTIAGLGDGAEAGMELGRVSAAATLLARDLGNRPAADKRPPALAGDVAELFADLPVEVEAWDQARLEDEGFGGHLAVAAGSEVEPRFVQLRYRPDGAEEHIGLLGKGITFDSGGLSIKSSKGQAAMKIDMAGAATVVAVVRAVATAGWPVSLTGMLCMAENMPSGSATRPGDVITMHGGTTVEVLNTDAEGRLVMADGLAWSEGLDLDVLVDVATLTGAAMMALGPRYSALMTADEDLADELLAAASAAAEPLWRLPLAAAEYRADLKSDIADVRNVGGTGAGATRAALFLDRFVADGQRWAHLDIAGAAWNDSSPYHSYIPKGATGIPVRTLLEWISARLG